MDGPTIEDYLAEERTFPPSETTRSEALVSDRSLYDKAADHVEAGRGDRVAYHFEGEPGDTRTIT
jgi:hypothetical protein